MTKTLLKTKKPNRLEVFKCRASSVPPIHFEYIKIPLTYNLEDSISKWISENLKGIDPEELRRLIENLDFLKSLLMLN